MEEQARPAENMRRTAEFPRFMIAAERSGAGKTMLTCALLSLLKKAVGDVRAFKCGPDYIDPMFHSRVLGIPSYNLDSFFSDPDTLNCLLGRHGVLTGDIEKEPAPDCKRTGEIRDPYAAVPEKIGVIEGVMGYYDGLGGVSERASAYEVATLTKTPVVLIIDASGRSLSTIAAVKGFLSYREDSMIKGVIFNRLSPMMYPGLKKKAEEELGVRVLGYVPVLKEFTLESRHLGLIMPGEIPEFQKKVEALAEALRPVIDMDGLLSLAKEAEPVSWEEIKIPRYGKEDGSKPVISVAMDEAFCFYYRDNLELLERMGVKLSFFSPLHDRSLPPGTDGLYLGGGYPELFAKELSENRGMLHDIREKIMAGLPCIAECGGYLYLKESLCDEKGTPWPMAGVLPGTSENSGKLGRFGYITMQAKEDSILGKAGERFPAHEFHHWDSPENGSAFAAEKPVGKRAWECGYVYKNLYAGFPHLYFYSHFPCEFLRRAASKRTG